MKLFDFAAFRLIVSIASGVPRRVTLKLAGDFALVSAGVATAVGSIVFAGAMLLEGNHEPRVNGLQYLAIFAKPRGSSRPALAESPTVAAANRRVAGDALDMAPTGSIAQGAPDKAPTGSIAQDAPDKAPTGSIAQDAPDKAPTRSIAHDAPDMAPIGSIGHDAASGSSAAEAYRIIAVEPGMAWLSHGSEIRVVKPGDVAPGLGRVASIVRRDGRWALIDESGATLLTSDKPETKDLGNGDEPFARRMIFGAGN
ncbi:MAG: hypothetical protein ABR878_00310 [Roseiarcus sp.]|jgi:hypothetical protein